LVISRSGAHMPGLTRARRIRVTDDSDYVPGRLPASHGMPVRAAPGYRVEFNVRVTMKRSAHDSGCGVMARTPAPTSMASPRGTGPPPPPPQQQRGRLPELCFCSAGAEAWRRRSLVRNRSRARFQKTGWQTRRGSKTAEIERTWARGLGKAEVSSRWRSRRCRGRRRERKWDCRRRWAEARRDEWLVWGGLAFELAWVGYSNWAI
jgi:hypothetical protein